ncbi:MAG: hypothetical protein AAGA43_13450 [Bacteroidota bacterium]
MIRKLVEIGIHKKGNKRKLGLYLGFNEKYAGQRVNEILVKESVNYKTLAKLLQAAELDHFLAAAVDAEHKKIEGQ